MTVVVVTPPGEMPVSLDEAKQHLRVDFDDDDDLISMLIEVATAMFDGPNATIGRCFLKQTLELKLDGFPCSETGFDVFDRQRWRGTSEPYYHQDRWRRFFTRQEIPLPYPPFMGDLSVSYIDETGSSQTVDTSVYQVLGGGVGITRIGLKYNQAWPSVQFMSETVTIQWSAGYGEHGSDVPAPIRHAILLTVGHLYENRQDVYVDPSRVQALQMPQGAEALLAPFRILT